MTKYIRLTKNVRLTTVILRNVVTKDLQKTDNHFNWLIFL